MMSPETAPTGLLRQPVPLASRLRYVPFLVDVWCPMLRSGSLGAGECRSEMLLGTPLAIFRRRDGVVCALEDRCPHRGIPLSLGMVRGECIQCAYHGWMVRGDGTVHSAPGIGPLDGAPRTRVFAVREYAGLIWVFLGSVERAAVVPLPDLAPYGSHGSVDLPLALNNETHWSLLFDNGLDLFHGHLHRGVPYFFDIHALEEYTIRGEVFSLRYRATLGAAFNTRRKGSINITVSTTAGCARLDFDGLPVVSVVATPHSQDGTRLTAWYLFSFPLPPFKRAVLRLTLPFVRRALVRGFTQDATILRAELGAMKRGLLVQNEVNPLLIDVHGRADSLLAGRATDGIRQHGKIVDRRRDEIVAAATAGTLAVLGNRGGRMSFLSPREVDEALPQSATVSVVSYFHYCLVDLPEPHTQLK